MREIGTVAEVGAVVEFLLNAADVVIVNLSKINYFSGSLVYI